MEVKWNETLLKVAEEVMKSGGKIEFIVYKRGNKRKPLIHKYIDNEISCDEETLIE